MTEASEAVSVYRYPLSNLIPDYLRSAAGVGLLGVPAIYSVGTHWIVTAIMGGLVALFGTFGASTAIRQFSVLLVDQHGMRLKGPRPVALPWADIAEIDLRFFSTRRDRANGWFQLKVRGRGGQIKADSNLEDFDGLLRELAIAIARHDLPVSAIGRENFASAGYAVPVLADSD